MSIYEHRQGSYESYRVARSVNGELRQKYFPRTSKGKIAAEQLDQEWANEQHQAQDHFSGTALRWSRITNYEKRKPRGPLRADHHGNEDASSTPENSVRTSLS